MLGGFAERRSMQVVAEKFHKAVPEAFLGHGVAFLQVVYKHPQSPGTPGQCWVQISV